MHVKSVESSNVLPLVWKFKKTNSVENKQSSGRIRIFNEREERWIVRQVHINPRTRVVNMSLQCKRMFEKSLNPETVRSVLRKHKYHGRVPQRKPDISKANRQARSAFAKMYVRQPTEYW
ncbi:transposable element Tc1 transposase [Trichonephila clavipes]|nr:transposable element Tc1 transposase [Trichonephila clavipes]